MNQTRKDVLNGWKEIAAYLGRDPRTVERWEKQRSLPVRRLPGSGRATVYALTSELDNWLANGPPRETEGSGVPASPDPVGSLPERKPADPGDPETPEPMAGGPDTGGSAKFSPAGPAVRRPEILRRSFAAASVLLLCGAGLAAAAWRHNHAGATAAPGTVPATPRSRRMVPSSPVIGVEELYLRGCYQTETRTPESLHRAEEAFAQAITKDPRYAPAYAGLASVYILLREASMMPDPEAYAKAKDAALKAMALDPDLPQAHAAMGFVTFFGDWNAAESERQFQTALRLDPDLPLAHHWYGSVLTHEGRFREGLAELDVAQRLDPSSAAILTLRAFAMGLNGRQAEGYDMLAEAVSAERPGQARNPATMHGVLATLSLLPPRNIPHYIAETTQEAEVRQDTQTIETMRLAGEVYRRRGERAMWRALLEDEKKRRPDGSPDYAIARYQAELGEKDKALDTLTELFSRHDPALIGISVDPLFANLRQDPRYERLRAAMGLPGVRET